MSLAKIESEASAYILVLGLVPMVVRSGWGAAVVSLAVRALFVMVRKYR